MSATEHDKSQETTDRPEGNVDEDANPPLIDPTETDVDRDPNWFPRGAQNLLRRLRDAKAKLRRSGDAWTRRERTEALRRFCRRQRCSSVAGIQQQRRPHRRN